MKYGYIKLLFFHSRTVRQCAESLRNDLPPESESSNLLQTLVFDLRTDTMRTILKQVSSEYYWLVFTVCYLIGAHFANNHLIGLF